MMSDQWYCSEVHLDKREQPAGFATKAKLRHRGGYTMGTLLHVEVPSREPPAFPGYLHEPSGLSFLPRPAIPP